MRVAVEALEPAREPHVRAYHEQMLAMLLQPGSIEMAGGDLNSGDLHTKPAK
jgi:hypothetical protein